MAKRTEHQVAAAIAAGLACAYLEAGQREKTATPLAGALLAAGLTNLPDFLEPAAHPNHRQFFHSIAFAGLLAYTTHHVYMWETDNPVDEAIRFVLLVGASAYFVHLLLDACTAKSLPILGKL